MFKRCLFLILILSILLPVQTVQSQTIKKKESSDKFTYYSKTSLDGEEWDIQWNSKYAISGSNVIYSYSPKDGCDEEWTGFDGKVLSIVGSYISFEEVGGGFCEGAAHPFSYQHFKTTDLKTGKAVSLLDLFNETEIFKALLKDKIIKKSLKGKKPRNLKELFRMADGGCEYAIYDGILKSFAFHHIKGDEVAVRIGVPYGCEVMRHMFTQLGIYLPIPERLKKDLNASAANQLLMKEMSKLSYD